MREKTKEDRAAYCHDERTHLASLVRYRNGDGRRHIEYRSAVGARSAVRSLSAVVGERLMGAASTPAPTNVADLEACPVPDSSQETHPNCAGRLIAFVSSSCRQLSFLFTSETFALVGLKRVGGKEVG